jgi:uncharacterized protein YbaP (TraB family)
MTSIPLWRLDSREDFFILGAVHAADDSIHPLDPRIDEAYRNAKLVAFETNPEVTLDVVAYQDLPAHRTFSDLVSTSTLRLLKQTANQLDLVQKPLLKQKPWACALDVKFAALAKRGFTSERAVDLMFWEKAKADQKEAVPLEPGGHLSARLDSLDARTQEAHLTFVLENLEDDLRNYPAVLSAWKNGDLDTLERLLLEKLRGTHPELFQTLFTERNRFWMTELLKLADRPEPVLAIVGTGHLLGAGGLVELLGAAGKPLTQVQD